MCSLKKKAPAEAGAGKIIDRLFVAVDDRSLVTDAAGLPFFLGACGVPAVTAHEIAHAGDQKVNHDCLL